MKNEPIFIVSPLNRSGTNFLANIIQLDPQFEIPQNINEDYFLVYSNHIEAYVNKTIKHWSKPIRDEYELFKCKFLNIFGDTILNIANQNLTKEKRPLFKCPRSNNIQNAFRLFPNSRYIFCIRDGRDTVESFRRSFDNYTFPQICKLWADGVTRIINFINEHKNTAYEKQILFIKYENIFKKDPHTIHKIKIFVGSKGNYISEERIESLPLKGSSTHRGNNEKLHWEPIKKPSGFNPISRWSRWTPLERVIFKIVAGKALNYAGYK